MYSLNIQNKIGDIILIKSESKKAKVISSSTGGNFSHACLVIGERTIIEAIGGSGVQVSSIERFLFKSKDNVAVLRPKLNENEEQILFKFVKEHIYDYQSLGYDIKGGYVFCIEFKKRKRR